LQRNDAHRAIDTRAGVEGEVHIARGSVGMERERAGLQQETARENDGSDRKQSFHSNVLSTSHEPKPGDLFFFLFV
jgi:hypothetical protein